MKRLYTDPLEAAYMAKHYGMRFGIEHKGVVHFNCIGKVNEPLHPLKDVADILDPISNDEYAGGFHIHPDSLHLLEPIPLDLIHNGCCSNYYVVCEERDCLSASNEVELHHAREWFSGDHHGRIIQRDGKAFFWPESEAA